MSRHSRTSQKLNIISILFLLCSFLFPLSLQAQNYPGAGLFSYQCEEGGILFFYQGNPALWTSYEQARQTLQTAINTYINQPIITLNGISLWALRSNEFQIHLTDNPDGTKLVFPSNICGTLVTSSPQIPTTSTGLAYVQSADNGEAMAYVDISPTGGISIYLEVKGNAMAFGFGQTTRTSTFTNGQQIHIVQAGENLFRIALKYNTSVSAIAAANNISDVTRIYVGQQLIIR